MPASVPGAVECEPLQPNNQDVPLGTLAGTDPLVPPDSYRRRRQAMVELLVHLRLRGALSGRAGEANYDVAPELFDSQLFLPTDITAPQATSAGVAVKLHDELLPVNVLEVAGPLTFTEGQFRRTTTLLDVVVADRQDHFGVFGLALRGNRSDDFEPPVLVPRHISCDALNVAQRDGHDRPPRDRP